MNAPILTLELHLEQDIVHARQRARQLADLLGFDAQDQTRIATAVSEIARNAFQYAGGGKVEFASISNRAAACDPDQRPGSRHRGPATILDGPLSVADRHGPGHHRRAPADGRASTIETRPGGTTVAARQALPARAAADTPRLVEDRGGAGAAAPDESARRAPAAEPGAAARARGAARQQDAARAGSTASSRRPTAAWSRSTPSSTSGPITCSARTRSRRGSSPT